jgi:hypothetical protein
MGKGTVILLIALELVCAIYLVMVVIKNILGV